ncbi:MAG TPA: S8 family serine peptidase, partial [Oculatellaceae cyanobacterium]
ENLSSPTPDSRLPTPYFQDSQEVSPLEQKQKRLARVLPQMVKRQGLLLSDVSSVSSEGDKSHGAALARYTYGVDGSYRKNVGGTTKTQRVKIGVLSDSYNNLGGAATDIANGDLPSDGVTLVGSGDLPRTSPYYPGIDEGRAMLQIIHDLAPGAKLYFATAFADEAGFASNIRALRQAGCDIIVDDVIYFSEPVFQDGIVAQAVNNVTARGALYFSSAGNLGNKNDSQSGVWEGDFIDGGAAPLRLSGRVHRFTFGAAGLSNKITSSQYSSGIMLQWADPWGQSTNDYDLYVLNSAGTAVIASSTDFQSGNADPIELVPPQAANSQVIIVQYSGQRRYLHLNILGGRLATNTPGQTWGHSAAVNAFSVAAVSAKGRINLFTGGAENPVETFSSDGLRRVFYTADGTPITPGIFLSYGGSVRQKPDIAAADGVKTSLPSPLNRFYGTSAAAPHAAGVAALLKSFRPSLNSAEIRSILKSTTLDIEAGGLDQDSGYGIVMANRALDKAAQTPIVSH